MYIIIPKYDIGDRVFLIRKTAMQERCGICEGEGIIDYKTKKMTCPECHGLGHFKLNKSEYIADPHSVTIVQIRVHINSKDSLPAIQYKCESADKSFVREESILYPTIEAAQSACYELNRRELN